jgi:hypothetical protein
MAMLLEKETPGLFRARGLEEQWKALLQGSGKSRQLTKECAE